MNQNDNNIKLWIFVIIGCCLFCCVFGIILFLCYKCKVMNKEYESNESNLSNKMGYNMGVQFTENKNVNNHDYTTPYRLNSLSSISSEAAGSNMTEHKIQFTENKNINNNENEQLPPQLPYPTPYRFTSLSSVSTVSTVTPGLNGFNASKEDNLSTGEIVTAGNINNESVNPNEDEIVIEGESDEEERRQTLR